MAKAKTTFRETPRTRRETLQVYNDGVLSLIRDDGTPLYREVRYQRRIVGSVRYFAAAQAESKIDLLVRVPLLSGVASGDGVALASGTSGTADSHQTYRIEQIQVLPDVLPPSMDLSLRATRRIGV